MSPKGNNEVIYPFGHTTIPSSQIVMTSRLSYVAVNIKPVVPYHLLVIPKRQGTSRLYDLTCDETADLFNLAKKAQRLVEQVRGVKSSTIAIQDGEDAGQTVKHVHVHVLPREKDDFAENDDIYSELAKHDQPNAETRRIIGYHRSLEDMEKEAEILRQYMQENEDKF